MRVTSSMYYDSLYGTNNSKLSENLFDVNKQIASGLKIQYAKDDVRTFTETMRLDNELSTLGQIKKSTQSGYKISNQTDVVLNEFGTTMDRMRTLFIQAGNGPQSETSLDAISNELRVLEEHFRNLSNTSINGQFLFSGSAVDIKPISADGTYNGNDEALEAFLGSNARQQYNISGEQLFFGEEILTNRKITTNVEQYNLSEEYNFITGEDSDVNPSPITSDDTIRDLMGDTDGNSDSQQKHHFYIRGTSSDGTAFKQKISMQDDNKVDELLGKIGEAYGNTPNLKVVNVSLNSSGQIVIKDKIKGSSKIDFHMVAAVDFNKTIVDSADVTDINLLDSGERNFSNIMSDLRGGGTPGLYVKEFIQSGLTSANGAATKIDGIVYDQTEFSKDGSKLSSNVAQIVKDGNAFASASTKLSEVADITKGTTSTADDTLANSQFILSGKNVSGTDYRVQIDLAVPPSTVSTFSLDGGATNYNIYNTLAPREAVSADDITYKQLMDVINMVVTEKLPASTSSAVAYDGAIESSNYNGSTFLSYDGKIQFQEIGSSNTKASIALYDSNSDSFALKIATDGSLLPNKAVASSMIFNSNNALTIVDAKTDFFKELDEMITAVEDHKLNPDSSSGSIRNVGIENAISKIDALQDHVIRTHSIAGAQSNALEMASQRSDLLEVSTKTLRSEVIDTDLAEASLNLTKLTKNYEAMLSTVGKVSKLSLVNYL